MKQRLLWDLALQLGRLRGLSLTGKLVAALSHVVQIVSLPFFFVAVASPRSTLATQAYRVLGYTLFARADVDMGPVVWHCAFLFFCVWAGLLAAGCAWLLMQPKSSLR